MPADNKIEMVGHIVFEPEPGEGNRPGRFRIATYCSGNGDNKRTAFVGVKSFDNDTIRTLAKGQKVRVVGRFDPWNPEGDVKRQVLDVMADDEGITPVEREDDRGNGRARAGRVAPPRRPAYDSEEPF